MASSAAGEPPPAQPGGWLSGLVSGAGRILSGVAAVLAPDSASDATSSSPDSESFQSPPRPPPRRAAPPANGTHFPSGSYQFNKSGMEIVLKDYDNDSLELLSDMDRKDALSRLLMQESFSRSEYDALTKIIQDRVADEPDPVLPIAWQPTTQQHPVALSLKNSPPRTSGDPAYSLLFDNTGEKRGLRKSATILEVPSLKNLSHDQRQHVTHVVKRGFSNTLDTFDEPRRVMPKLNRSNTSEKVFNAVFDDPVTNYAGELRGFPDKLKDISLLGTDNLTFSSIASKSETAKSVRHLATTSHQANLNKHGSAMFYPYSYQDLTETFPVKVEPLDEFASLKPEMMHLAQRNDERTMSNDSSSVSKMVFQEGIETAPSSLNGLKGENSSRNPKKGFNLQGSIPTKARFPATASSSRRRPNNRGKVRSWNGPLQQSNPAPVGQEPNTRQVQAKRPVGKPKKAKRSRNTEREVKTKRRLEL